jgi:hypothetical protein
VRSRAQPLSWRRSLRERKSKSAHPAIFTRGKKTSLQIQWVVPPPLCNITTIADGRKQHDKIAIEIPTIGNECHCFSSAQFSTNNRGCNLTKVKSTSLFFKMMYAQEVSSASEFRGGSAGGSSFFCLPKLRAQEGFV